MTTNAPELHSNSGPTDLQLAVDGHILAVFAVDGGEADRHRERLEATVAAELTQAGHDVAPVDVAERIEVLADRGELREDGGVLYDAR